MPTSAKSSPMRVGDKHESYGLTYLTYYPRFVTLMKGLATQKHQTDQGIRLDTPMYTYV